MPVYALCARCADAPAVLPWYHAAPLKASEGATACLFKMHFLAFAFCRYSMNGKRAKGYN